MKQNALTVVVPIKSGQEGPLEDYLTLIGEDIMGNRNNTFVHFSKSPSTHFARWAILRKNKLTKTQSLGQRLFFSSNFDGDLDAYLKELVDVMGPGMEDIWNKCEGYAAGVCRDVAKFTRFIKKYSLKNQAFYVGFPGITVQEIASSMGIRKLVNQMLDSKTARKDLTDLRARLYSAQQPCVSSRGARPNLAELHGQPPVPLVQRILERSIGIKHGGDPNPNSRVETSSDLSSIEDKAGVVQNQMTAITPIKPGMWPRIALRIWLVGVINWFRSFLILLENGRGLHWRLLRRLLFFLPKAGPPGQLNGITTIHFARWAVIDRGKNLLFESNYDGSWEKYIDDFVDLSAFGMNMIWANCIDFPLGGCRDIETFKVYIRDSQLPTQVFYSAYPDETVLNIVNDLECRRALEPLLQQRSVERFLSGCYTFP